jgi:hypothetical protein
LYSTICSIARLTDSPSSGPFAREFLFGLSEPMIGVPQEYQPQHGHRVFRRLQLGVRPQFIGGRPKPFLDFRVIVGHAGRFPRVESVKPMSLPAGWVIRQQQKCRNKPNGPHRGDAGPVDAGRN